MIELNRLNGQSVLVNPDLIRFIEATPDTVLTFLDGEKFMVKDDPKTVVSKIVAYRKECSAPKSYEVPTKVKEMT